MGHRRKQWKSENRGKFNETFKTCRLLKQHLKENWQPKLLKLEKEGRLALFSYVCNLTSKKKQLKVKEGNKDISNNKRYRKRLKAKIHSLKRHNRLTAKFKIFKKEGTWKWTVEY